MHFHEEDSFVIKFVSGESYEKETLTLGSEKLYIDRHVNRINIYNRIQIGTEYVKVFEWRLG